MTRMTDDELRAAIQAAKEAQAEERTRLRQAWVFAHTAAQRRNGMTGRRSHMIATRLFRAAKAIEDALVLMEEER